jgi:hypothetical protein
MNPIHRTLPALLTAALAAAAVAGCSSDSDPRVASAASPETTAASTGDATPPAAYQPTCPNPYGGRCLGPLEPGTYRTRVFEPGIRYTVPDGWVNAEDLPGNFLLHREDDPQDGFTGGSYLGIYADIRAPHACKEAWADGVGHTPAALAQWYVDHPGLAASEPRPVEVGGLEGLMVDVPLAEDWKGRCPWSQGNPVVPVIIGGGASDLFHVSLREIDVRLILLEWKDANLTIEVTNVHEQHSQREWLAMVEPILDSLEFRA